MSNQEQLQQLYGTVESVTFHNGENGFTVMEIISDDAIVTVVGVLPEVFPGEELSLYGTWGSHPTFGEQFKAESCERHLPASSDAVLRYLSSGAIKGIGPATAARIVERFGDETLAIMENEPEKLSLIRGISKAKALKIAEEYRTQFGIRETMMFLGQYGITPNETLRVWKKWGSFANDKIKENPYILCSENVNISFERADEIAAVMGKPSDDAARIKAGIVYVLKHNLNSGGHTCLPSDKLVTVTENLLGVEHDKVFEQYAVAISEGEIVCDDVAGREFAFLPALHRAENYCAGRLKMMLELPPDEIEDFEKDIENIEKGNYIEYAQLQKEAIRQAMQKGMLVLTGGPGTGKTTTLNAIIQILLSRGLKVDIAAPTGRAAKRLTEITEQEAKTIHRLLEAEYSDEERSVFAKDERNPLDCDALIIDELSMTDSLLFDSLLRAVPMRCRLILVGDKDQLPSVGAGNILHDMILSGEIPVVQLTEVFRQAQSSAIVTNAHKIVKGEMPDLSLKRSDFFFITATNAAMAQDKIIELATKRLPNAYNYDPLTDIQILAPSKKGAVGTIEINRCMQQVLNPPDRGKREHQVHGVTLREGDKVMQMRNNYDITWTKDDGTGGQGVYNGDIGTLERIDKMSSTLVLRFDDKQALYPMDCAAELDLAYAMTVHKSQGSEFEAVVMPVFPGPPQLYYRNLLYTAVTRAKNLIVLVGLQSTVKKMVDNDKRTNRYSALKEFLSRDE